jgi:glutathione-regulated potassium-efflux system ancillary protein KefG
LGRNVDTDDLIDAREVAEILGLEQSNSVTTYLRRYADMPRPAIEKGGGRLRLWLKPEVERWNRERPRRAVGKPPITIGGSPSDLAAPPSPKTS